jgi:hypothetical protein
MTNDGPTTLSHVIYIIPTVEDTFTFATIVLIR